jgi:hypothetical protein
MEIGVGRWLLAVRRDGKFMRGTRQPASAAEQPATNNKQPFFT